jgi:glycosyltransferase involved in cell wall biosynthesis
MNLTPCLHVKNEEHFIGHVLRPLLKTWKRGILLDTGSTDRTVDIARDVARSTGGELTIIEEDMQNDAVRIGQCSTRLREMVTTDWMLLVDGDEIWNEAGLRALMEYTVPDGKRVCMVNARNVRLCDGRPMRAEGWSADRLFAPGIRWDKRCEFPFQSYSLNDTFDRNLVHYIEQPDVWFWHVRHLVRSSKDTESYFRMEKLGYFPYNGPYEELPSDWCGQVEPSWPNPYLNANG